MNLIGLLMNPVDSCHNNESCRFISSCILSSEKPIKGSSPFVERDHQK